MKSRGCRSLRAPLPCDGVGHDRCARGGHAVLVSGPGLVSCPQCPPGDEHHPGVLRLLPVDTLPQTKSGHRSENPHFPEGPYGTRPFSAPAPMAERDGAGRGARAAVCGGAHWTPARPLPSASPLREPRPFLPLRGKGSASLPSALSTEAETSRRSFRGWGRAGSVPHARGCGVWVIRVVSCAGQGWLRLGRDRRAPQMGR